jgi:hypothetical protein
LLPFSIFRITHKTPPMKNLLLLFFTLLFSWSFAQTDSIKNEVKVFLDCEFCDGENLKQEFSAVAYVRDRKLCNVHILVTERETGSGGSEFTFCFLGRDNFAGINDTVVVKQQVNSTEDEQRDLLNKVIQLGLVRYILHSSNPTSLSIISEEGSEDNSETKDKWNYWVFELSASSWFSWEKSYSDISINSSFSANRTTEENKFEMEFGNFYSERNFQVSDTERVSSLFRSWFGEALYVKSISDHWSAGGFSNYNSSLFNNLKHNIYLGAGIEYNIYPYSESTSKRFSFAYSIGPRYDRYYDTTIFYKTSQLLLSHRLNIEAGFIRKWGSVETSVNYTNFLHDFKLMAISYWLSARIRVAKGLTLNFSAYYSYMKNQISLPLDEASAEEILLRQVQLPTTNQLFGDVGISFLFGSIYNNIVNPRF